MCAGIYLSPQYSSMPGTSEKYGHFSRHVPSHPATLERRPGCGRHRDHVSADGKVRYSPMWTSILIMAIAVIVEPVRTALVILMLNRPRPLLQLLAFLCGGFTVCVAFGLAVLFMFRTLPVAGAAAFSVGQAHIAIGLFVMLVASVLAKSSTGAGDDAGTDVVKPTTPQVLGVLQTRIRDVLQGSSLWVAGVTGALNLPSANYMAALAVIFASKAAPAAQLEALLVFNVVAFAVVGMPLVSYVAAPEKTRALMLEVQGWLRSRRRREVAALAAVAGCFILGLGVVGL